MLAGFPHETQYVVSEGEQCPAEKVTGFLGSWAREGRGDKEYMRSFVHPSTHSPSSLLATTGNKALCWALGESERHQAYAQPFRSS